MWQYSHLWVAGKEPPRASWLSQAWATALALLSVSRVPYQTVRLFNPTHSLPPGPEPVCLPFALPCLMR